MVWPSIISTAQNAWRIVPFTPVRTQKEKQDGHIIRGLGGSLYFGALKLIRA